MTSAPDYDLRFAPRYGQWIAPFSVYDKHDTYIGTVEFIDEDVVFNINDESVAARRVPGKGVRRQAANIFDVINALEARYTGQQAVAEFGLPSLLPV